MLAMPPTALHLARALGMALLAGFCASGSCSLYVSSDHDRDDCDGCFDGCGCDGDCDWDCCDGGCCCDLELAAPPVLEVLVIDEGGAVHAGYLWVPPAGGR